MGDWSRLIELVPTIINLVVTGDGRLGWVFLVDGVLGKGDRSSINNHKFSDHRGWKIGMGICDV